MDIEECRRRVAAIEAAKDNDENAHSQQDRLYRDVLQAIADGADFSLGHAISLAREALAVEDIEFDRWCA